MVSLYKRATPSQARILRIVEGAVRNAAHGHPEIDVPETFARSVAKRACGTLTSQWGEVLAARSASSDGALETVRGSGARVGLNTVRATRRGAVQAGPRRSPLVGLWADIQRLIREPKRLGNEERVKALVDVLKMIAARQKDRSL